MAISTRVVVVFLLLASIVATGSQAEVSCGTVVDSMYPCIPYVLGGGHGPVPETCCNSIRMLKEVAKSVAERKDVCECIKSLLPQVPSRFIPIIASLPPKCRVDLPYKIDRNMDCKSVQFH